MPKFSYTVKDGEGKTFKNVIDAAHQRAVIEKLQKQNYFIVSIKEITVTPTKQKTTAAVSPKRKKKFHHNKIKLNDLLIFARQLATMLEAGVTLIRSMDVILSQIESRDLHKVLVKVKKDVEQGGSLSAALFNHPKIFNQFWVSLVEVGEASGTLPGILNKLAFYLEQQAIFRSTIISAVIYPGILFTVACGAIVFFALVVAPKFQTIFETMGVELPAITTFFLVFFEVIKNNFFKIIMGIVVGIFLLKKFINTYPGRLLFEKICFNIPTVGEIYKLIIVERFSSQMSILIDAGVPILYALDITERLVNNNTCALIVGTIKEGVRGGELLVEPMKRSEFFPPLCIQLITVGEETGELSKMLKHVAAFYQDAVETFMKRFATIIEPFMLVFMGGVIGTIVTAMFLPMFNLATLG